MLFDRLFHIGDILTDIADRPFITAGMTTLAVMGSDARGVAPTPGDGTRGTLAYVFPDKVTSFAVSHRLDVAHVLACALAHEIGHLLLPRNAHRPDSVMRVAAGIRRSFRREHRESWDFLPDQAKLLRLRARRA